MYLLQLPCQEALVHRRALNGFAYDVLFLQFRPGLVTGATKKEEVFKYKDVYQIYILQ